MQVSIAIHIVQTDTQPHTKHIKKHLPNSGVFSSHGGPPSNLLVFGRGPVELGECRADPAGTGLLPDSSRFEVGPHSSNLSVFGHGPIELRPAGTNHGKCTADPAAVQTYLHLGKNRLSSGLLGQTLGERWAVCATSGSRPGFQRFERPPLSLKPFCLGLALT